MSAVARIPLPASYLTLLRSSNGGKGPLPIEPWKFCLDSAELAYLRECGGKLFKQFFPNFFVFGTNGGNDAIALDGNVPASYPVVRFDMANCNLIESVKRLFAGLRHLLEPGRARCRPIHECVSEPCFRIAGQPTQQAYYTVVMHVGQRLVVKAGSSLRGDANAKGYDSIIGVSSADQLGACDRIAVPRCQGQIHQMSG